MSTLSRVGVGSWDEMRAAAQPIRFTVFVDEQRVPAEIEIDDWDERSLHAVAFDEQGRPVGTARLLPDGHIGRMAVLAHARAAGIGSALLTRLMEEARRRGHAEIRLSAQTHAIAFYARHGYKVISDEYLDAGIAHVDMRCPLGDSD